MTINKFLLLVLSREAILFKLKNNQCVITNSYIPNWDISGIEYVNF